MRKHRNTWDYRGNKGGLINNILNILYIQFYVFYIFSSASAEIKYS